MFRFFGKLCNHVANYAAFQKLQPRGEEEDQRAACVRVRELARLAITLVVVHLHLVKSAVTQTIFHPLGTR